MKVGVLLLDFVRRVIVIDKHTTPVVHEALDNRVHILDTPSIVFKNHEGLSLDAVNPNVVVLWYVWIKMDGFDEVCNPYSIYLPKIVVQHGRRYVIYLLLAQVVNVYVHHDCLCIVDLVDR